MLLDQIRAVALRTATLTGIRGVARVDFLSDGSGELWLNEVNTIPGSLARYLWVDPPVSFGDLLEAMVEEAEKVPGVAHERGRCRRDGASAGRLDRNKARLRPEVRSDEHAAA